ncbi:catalase family protein [Halomonas sp. 328]|uniref:hypothetical protein n=1 Tax=Halomonas sp. 328 TaxID=2776704 RepID=UPI0018A7670A|nr:hypothetical protein [Halomonas sp. 328]MBF8222401.1 hypothetical protein [Halomonas sp. 328]
MPSPTSWGLAARRLALVAALAGLAGCGEEPPPPALGEERVGPGEAALAAVMTERILEIGERHRAAGEPIPRFNQPKTVACATATFEVPPLDDDLAEGLFAEPGRYEALVRFANATRDDDRDKDLRGASLRLFGVPGAESLAGPPGQQDFLFNSHPALFAGTPEAFYRFVNAVADERLWWYFVNPLAPQPRSLMIALRARGQPESPLAVTYWSTTPYRFGEGRAVKYSLRACAGEPPPVAAPDHPDHLRHALAARLEEGPACLSFQVQFQTDPEAMPIEDASVVWDEAASPFRPVGRLLLHRQTIDTPQALARCESLVFNPWNTHPAHRPLGGINRLRRAIYQAAGAQRTTHNATLSGESPP